MNRFKNILFVVEPDDDYGPALDKAVTLARNNQAQLTLVNVIPMADELQADMLRFYQEDLQRLAAGHGEGIDMHCKVLTVKPPGLQTPVTLEEA